MTCATCGAAHAPVVRSFTENVHERACTRCDAGWLASVNRKLFDQHVKEGRDGAALSELRNWQALQRRVAC
jgi:hypothetical protein